MVYLVGPQILHISSVWLSFRAHVGCRLDILLHYFLLVERFRLLSPVPPIDAQCSSPLAVVAAVLMVLVVLQVIKGLRKHTKALLDAHLMVSHPAQWVDDMAAAGVDRRVSRLPDPRYVNSP